MCAYCLICQKLKLNAYIRGVLTYLHSMPLKFYKSCADSLLLALHISFFSHFFHFSCLFFLVVLALCGVLCVNGERLRSQAKSHKTHSSNPQSHSSWVIYLTLSVMDKYYVAPNALDRRRVGRATLVEALQRQQLQLQQRQMATDTTTATMCGEKKTNYKQRG